MHSVDINGRSILVTGCSSGIGRSTATYLAHSGFTVFATVRREKDASALRQLGEPNLIPAVVQLVTDELQHRGQQGLYAIVNNAGAGVMAPIELTDIGKFRNEFDARILGPVALLQAFLPMIRQAWGRIVWITTPGLLPIPYVASIHAPDFAVNCLARTLNLELSKWHIPVIMVRCGTIQTAAPDRSAREMQAAIPTRPSDRLALYQEALEKLRVEFGRLDQKRTPVEEVARVIYTALSARRPRLRYQVGRLSGLAATMELLPQSLVDAIMMWRE